MAWLAGLAGLAGLAWLGGLAGLAVLAKAKGNQRYDCRGVFLPTHGSSTSRIIMLRYARGINVTIVGWHLAHAGRTQAGSHNVEAALK